MSKLILEIPDEITAQLRIPPDECLLRVRTELAIRLYQCSPSPQTRDFGITESAL